MYFHPGRTWTEDQYQYLPDVQEHLGTGESLHSSLGPSIDPFIQLSFHHDHKTNMTVQSIMLSLQFFSPCLPSPTASALPGPGSLTHINIAGAYPTLFLEVCMKEVRASRNCPREQIASNKTLCVSRLNSKEPFHRLCREGKLQFYNNLPLRCITGCIYRAPGKTQNLP